MTRKKWQFEDTYAQSRSCASKYVALCTTTDLEYTHTQHRILTGSPIQAGQHGTKVTSLWLAFGRLNTCLCIYTFSGSDYRRSNCLKNSAATSHSYRKIVTLVAVVRCNYAPLVPSQRIIKNHCWNTSRRPCISVTGDAVVSAVVCFICKAVDPNPAPSYLSVAHV